MSYDHTKVESKWQEFWRTHQTFAVHRDVSKPKFYILDMFPYPSGAGLHVGHTLGYTGSDVIARYKKMRGFNVLHPMGWDSFGLPAEQFAVRTGQHPAVTTARNIDRYRSQLQAMGFSYDWSREVATSHPKYYKWTQWMFTLMYERGLAYQAEVLVNYCPALSAILANEEVENGRAKEGGYEVIRKPLRQWLLKITAYAERLLEDLEALDWPEALKRQQRHWIGKSVGVEVEFAVVDIEFPLRAFTTRADTLLGVTFLALAPEHPILERVPDSHKASVAAYRDRAARRSDIQRSEGREKSGAFSGLYARHPVTEVPIPIWVADYVLSTYGTGAVMGVPAHDERDFAFAHHYQLPVIQVIEARQDGASAKLAEHGNPAPYLSKGTLCNCACVALENLNGLSSERGAERITTWLQAKGRGEPKITYKLRDWLFSRQRYWGEPIPIVHFADGTKRCLNSDELPLVPPQIEDFKPDEFGQSPLAKATDWCAIWDEKTQQNAQREINTMPQWAGSCWYYLRFCSPKDDSAFVDAEDERYWLPVDAYVGGAEHAVLHLLYARFWHKVLFDCNLVSTNEPFRQLKTPGMLIARSYRLAAGGYIDAAEVEQLPDRSHVQVSTGAAVLVQDEKMSKSKLNGVNPDDLLERFGADALRIYEMFMGPFDREKVWNTDAVTGSRRFLQRVHQLVSRAISPSSAPSALDERASVLTHQLLRSAEEDFENWQFNTLIAKMMEYLNDISSSTHYSRGNAGIFVRILAPFAPHLAEELWERLGNQTSISHAPFPKVDSALIESARPKMITFVIQVNGKLRARLLCPPDTSQDALLAKALAEPAVAKFVENQPLGKIIFIPEKLLNITFDS